MWNGWNAEKKIDIDIRVANWSTDFRLFVYSVLTLEIMSICNNTIIFYCIMLICHLTSDSQSRIEKWTIFKMLTFLFFFFGRLSLFYANWRRTAQMEVRRQTENANASLNCTTPMAIWNAFVRIWIMSSMESDIVCMCARAKSSELYLCCFETIHNVSHCHIIHTKWLCR